MSFLLVPIDFLLLSPYTWEPGRRALGEPPLHMGGRAPPGRLLGGMGMHIWQEIPYIYYKYRIYGVKYFLYDQK